MRFKFCLKISGYVINIKKLFGYTLSKFNIYLDTSYEIIWKTVWICHLKVQELYECIISSDEVELDVIPPQHHDEFENLCGNISMDGLEF